MSGDNQEHIPDQGTFGQEPGVDAPSANGMARTTAEVALQEVIRPLAIAGMLTCVAVSIAQLIASVGGNWPGGLFAALVFCVSLESISSTNLIRKQRLSGQDRTRFRFVEWVILIIVARFVFYLHYGPARLASDMVRWAADIDAFFSLEFIAVTLLMALFWAGAMVLSRTMRELDPTPIEHLPSVTDPDHYLRVTMPQHGRINRRERLNRIASIFFAGGLVTVLLSGAARVNVHQVLVMSHDRTPGIIANVLIYFVLGFLLLSQSRYAVLRANWDIQEMPILSNMGRRWIIYVIGFLALVALISALLPVGYSVGLLDAVGAALQWIIWLILQIVFSILYVFSALIGWIFSLFREETAAGPTSPSFTAPPAAPTPDTGGGWPWWGLVRSLIFWTVVVGIVGYSVYHFALYRLSFFRNLRLGRVWDWLTRMWAHAAGATKQTIEAIRDALDERLAARRQRLVKSRWRYVAVGRLSPRDQIRYFYLSLLKRARDAGHGRPAWVTPSEYQEQLDGWLEESGEDIEGLTQAFNEARYSAHKLEPERASTVKALWRHVKRAVVSARRRAKEDVEQADSGKAS